MTPFAELRAAVVAALEPAATVNDWTVHATPVDALSPPAYMLGWSDPWGVEPSTFCRYTVELTVDAIAGRVDPDPGVETVEAMVAAALDALEAAGRRARTWTAPRPAQIGGVAYLAATLIIPSTLTFGGT